MAEPDRQMYRTHRELGEDLISQYPDTYTGENPYLLGKRYAEKYSDEVGIEEAGGFFSSERYFDDFLETSGEVLKGGWDLATGVGGDIADAFALPFTRVDELASGDIEGAKRFPFMRSLAGLGQGAAADLWQQFARGIGVPEETISKVDVTATPAEQRAGRDVVAQYRESLEPYMREERPMQALANVQPFIPGKTLTKVAPKLLQRGLGADIKKAQDVAETVREGARIADPTNVLATLAKGAKLGATQGYPAIKRVAEPVKKFVDRATTKGRKFMGERAEDIAGFTTSVGPHAIRRLKERSAESPQFRDQVREWRQLPQDELYSGLYETFNTALRKVREKSQTAYKLAEQDLGPVLRKPLEEVKPGSVEEMQGALVGIIEEYGGTYKVEPPTYKRVIVGQREGPSPIFGGPRKPEDWPAGQRRGESGRFAGKFPPAQERVYGEVVDKPSRFEVSFENAGAVPEGTNLKGDIAREFERFLNLDLSTATGMDIHRLRKALDKEIQHMPGGGGSDDVYRGPFRVRTELRSALSNALETTYGEQYTAAMADYRAYAEMQRQMYNTFKLTGTDVDKKVMETILGELANTYNPNARQGLRPNIIQEFSDMAEMPELEASLLGAVFNPSISKGLAQRSIQAEFLQATAPLMVGGALGYGTGSALAGVGAAAGGFAAQQLLYSPRLFSEALLTFYDLPSLPSTQKVTQLTKRLTSNPKANAILRERLPLGVTLERIKNEAGVDAYDILATEEEKNPKLLQSLSKGTK